MINIKEIISFLESSKMKFEYCGSRDLNIRCFSTLENVKSHNIIWIKNPNKVKVAEFEKSQDLLIVTNKSNEYNLEQSNYIFCENTKEVFFRILDRFFNAKQEKTNISSKAVIESNCIGKNVYIGHNTYIGSDVEIGNNVKIRNNVSIEGKVIIGNGTSIFSGVVIGSDGYGYFQNSEGKNIKVPHFGGVIIGENVEIGANTCVDRGTLGDTVIGNNVKIDNLCHVAHNVIIEENVSVIALSMIAGSVVLKKNSYIAPSASIRNQLVIGENSLVGLGAVVVKNVEDNVVVAGIPAKIIKKNREDK